MEQPTLADIRHSASPEIPSERLNIAALGRTRAGASAVRVDVTYVTLDHVPGQPWLGLARLPPAALQADP